MNELVNPFGQIDHSNVFDKLAFLLPLLILLELVFGEIKKPETINYRTFKPEGWSFLCKNFWSC